MASKDTFVRHIFGGGFATDLGPSYDGGWDGNAQVAQLVVPWLNRCDNVMFDLDGGLTKSPGTSKINASALESGAAVRGCYDYWIQGTSGSPTQKRVVHVGTKIKADAADGVFADIATGVSATAVPSYATFNDELIISDDANSAPKLYDGTTCSALGGSPPNFAFCVEHKGKVFAAGVPGNPSTLYYSVTYNHEDWTGSGSGSVLIGTNDGSVITGLASYKNALIIFKGPKKGSIYVLTGDTPSTFSLATLRKNCGSAVWQNAIFQYQDDMAFVAADASIQRLSATNAFGSFQLAHLSRDITKYLNDNVNRSQLRKCWAVNWESRGIVLFTLPVNASDYPNLLLSLDYRFETPRFSPWPAYAGVSNSAILATDENDAARQVVLVGGNDGYLRKMNVAGYSIDDTTAINMVVKSPTLSYGTPHLKKTLSGGSVGFLPLTDDDMTLLWGRDDGTTGTVDVSQGGGDRLTPTPSSPFTLDSSTLTGADFVDTWWETVEGGEFRNIYWQMQSAGLDANVSVHSLSAFIRGGAPSMEN